MIILLAAMYLRDRVKKGYSTRITLEEAEHRVQYWAHEVLKRVMLVASDPQGW